MSINPVLTRDESNDELLPQPLPGETFILKRGDIWFDGRLPSGMGKLTAKGTMFFTNQRMVFVALSDRNSKDFHSFEIPLKQVTKYSFEQPIFGANYMDIRGEAAPGNSVQMVGALTTYWSFYNGGCGTFLPPFFRIMKSVQHTEHVDQIAAQVVQGQTAYTDANDPSIIYVVQPTVTGRPVEPGVEMTSMPSSTPVVTGSAPVVTGTAVAPPYTGNQPQGTVPVVTGVPVNRR